MNYLEIMSPSFRKQSTVLTFKKWSWNIGGSISATPPKGNIGGLGAGVDVGYSVTKQTITTTGQSFGCSTISGTGTQPGSICGFERVQMTAFTIAEKKCTGPCFGPISDIGTNCVETGYVTPPPKTSFKNYGSVITFLIVSP